MQLQPGSLAAHLKRQLLPAYLVSGDEPLQVQECCDQIRAAARAAGCTDRLLIEAGDARFDWRELAQGAAEMSLFAERRIIELRLPSGKPGAEGSRALCDYLGRAGDDVLLLVAGKIDKASLSSKWFRALDKAGATVQVKPVKARDLPNWLRQRLGAAGLGIDNDALRLLCERVEGNLLAAVQEVEKLKLLAADNHITLATAAAAVTDNARYDVFGMTDSALLGDTASSLRMLRGLRAEGTEPVLALWALAREIRLLHDIQLECEHGGNVQRALAARKVWPSRMATLQAALARRDGDGWAQLLALALKVDGCIKGYAPGAPWDELENLVLGLSRPA